MIYSALGGQQGAEHLKLWSWRIVVSFPWALGIEIGSSARAASALNCICLRLVASPITADTAPAWVFRLDGALVAPFILSDSTQSNTYTVSLAELHGVLSSVQAASLNSCPGLQ